MHPNPQPRSRLATANTIPSRQTPRFRPCRKLTLIAAAVGLTLLSIPALSQQGHPQHHSGQHGHPSSGHAQGEKAPQVQGGPVRATLEARSTGKTLERQLTITLKDSQTGNPVDGAAIVVHVDMPSMPMVHRVPKTKAEPTGQPGQYATTVTLEMAGEWSARVVVEKPSRATFIHRFNVDR